MATAVTTIILVALYFLPSFVAWRRQNHVAAIIAINLIFGWTVIGYAVALIMALWSNNRKPAAV